MVLLEIKLHLCLRSQSWKRLIESSGVKMSGNIDGNDLVYTWIAGRLIYFCAMVNTVIANFHLL